MYSGKEKSEKAFNVKLRRGWKKYSTAGIYPAGSLLEVTTCPLTPSLPLHDTKKKSLKKYVLDKKGFMTASSMKFVTYRKIP